MNTRVSWVVISDTIQFMSPHLWMYTQRRAHGHPKPLAVPISLCQFRNANFAAQNLRRKICGVCGVYDSVDLAKSKIMTLGIRTHNLWIMWHGHSHLATRQVINWILKRIFSKFQLAHPNPFEYHKGGASKKNVF